MDNWDCILLSILAVIVVSLCVIIYRKYNMSKCYSTADLSGKTVIITGANAGVGYFTAMDLARRNARVILACRNKERGQTACDEIKSFSGNDNVLVKLLDLSSMASVRQFAEDVINTERRLDILINNAGILGLPKIMTEEGLESMFATNHFGPFLLTNLLLDLMKKTNKARIVTVASVASKMGKINFDNLRAEKSFNKFTIYGDSKLANILFTRELARRLKGTGVTANCLHPGTIRSDLFRSLPGIIRLPMTVFGAFFFKSPEEGAQTSIYCAVSEELDGVSGRYFSECQDADSKAPSVSNDPDIARTLWEVSEKYTGLN